MRNSSRLGVLCILDLISICEQSLLCEISFRVSPVIYSGISVKISEIYFDGSDNFIDNDSIRHLRKILQITPYNIIASLIVFFSMPDLETLKK